MEDLKKYIIPKQLRVTNEYAKLLYLIIAYTTSEEFDSIIGTLQKNKQEFVDRYEVLFDDLISPLDFGAQVDIFENETEENLIFKLILEVFLSKCDYDYCSFCISYSDALTMGVETRSQLVSPFYEEIEESLKEYVEEDVYLFYTEGDGSLKEEDAMNKLDDYMYCYLVGSQLVIEGGVHPLIERFLLACGFYKYDAGVFCIGGTWFGDSGFLPGMTNSLHTVTFCLRETIALFNIEQRRSVDDYIDVIDLVNEEWNTVLISKIWNYKCSLMEVLF